MNISTKSTQKVFNKSELETFTKQLQSDSFVTFIESRIDYPFSDIKQEFNNYVEQAVYAVDLLSKIELANKRILEVGAGAGILTAWLLLNDIDVIGIEPSALGFHFHQDVFTAIWDYFKLPSNKVLDRSAEEIDEKELGKFDVIFSLNVMEHIPVNNLELVFQKMNSVLKGDGFMFHHCPNYTIPYEPHYGLPLVPYFPQMIGKLTGKIKESLWQSVNFITLSQVKKIADRNSLKAYFERGIMAESFNRLEYDQEFSYRHPSLAKLFPLLKKAGLIKLMEHLPPQFCTPMTFIITNSENKISFKNFE